MSRDIHTVIDGLSFTECPRWHDDRLWFVDFYTHRVLSVTEDGGDQRTEAEVPQQPSGLGWLPDGRMLVVSQRDQRLLRREPDGTLETHADLSDVVPGQLNDMIVDAQRPRLGRQLRLRPHGGRRRRADLAATASTPTAASISRSSDLWFPNGSVVTDDGRTLLVDETFGNRVSAFDIADDGGLAAGGCGPRSARCPPSRPRRALGQLSVAPDGCGLDAEGCLWIADALGGRVHPGAEGGEILDEVSPGTGVYACRLGGADGRTLFLLRRPGLPRAQPARGSRGRDPRDDGRGRCLRHVSTKPGSTDDLGVVRRVWGPGAL